METWPPARRRFSAALSERAGLRNPYVDLTPGFRGEGRAHTGIHPPEPQVAPSPPPV